VLHATAVSWTAVQLSSVQSVQQGAANCIGPSCISADDPTTFSPAPIAPYNTVPVRSHLHRKIQPITMLARSHLHNKILQQITMLAGSHLHNENTNDSAEVKSTTIT